jgi:hypothetical protein
METKHTKGPWKAVELGSVKHGIVSESHWKESGNLKMICVFNDREPETMENVKLLAAAPEMLESLIDQRQYLKEMLEDEIYPITDRVVRLMLHKLVSRLTVTIRKAIQG